MLLQDSDAGNEKAKEILAAIQNRLDGLVSKKSGGGGGHGGRGGSSSNKINMPLSVVGQVNHLIEEATSHENLSQMYLGWAAYY